LKTPLTSNEHTDRVSTWDEVTLASATPSISGTERETPSSFTEPIAIRPEILEELSDDELLYLHSLADPNHRYIH
jgi:hypothetical protein